VRPLLDDLIEHILGGKGEACVVFNLCESPRLLEPVEEGKDVVLLLLAVVAELANRLDGRHIESWKERRALG